MKTYIINMPKDKQKRVTIEHMFSVRPFYEYEFFRAIEGNRLTSEEIDEKVDFKALKERYGAGATLPAVGCSLSHWSIYYDISKNNIPTAIIFEDDAIINDYSEKYIMELQQTVFHQHKPAIVLLTPLFAYNVHSTHFNIGNHKIYKIIGGWMASGYMINLQAATILKNRLWPIQYVADDWKEFQKFGIEIYGIVPHVTSYYDGKGEIGQSVKRHKLTSAERFRIWRGNAIGYIKGERLSKKKW